MDQQPCRALITGPAPRPRRVDKRSAVHQGTADHAENDISDHTERRVPVNQLTAGNTGEAADQDPNQECPLRR